MYYDLGTAVGNIIMSWFDVTNDERYMRDSASDRGTVYATYLIDWGCALSSLFFVFLLPNQKVREGNCLVEPWLFIVVCEVEVAELGTVTTNVITEGQCRPNLPLIANFK